MIFHSAVISHVGCKRENNEDNYYLNGVYRQNVEKEIMQFAEPQGKRRMLAGVFDGAGGAAYGERASLMAAAALAGYQEISGEKILNQYIPQVNHMILQEIEHRGASMGTTMALLYLCGDMASVYNLGDSRIYLFREHRLMQITYDHTQAQLMQEKMADSPVGLYQEEFQYIKQQHILTKYLGMRKQKDLRPYFMERISVMDRDIFVLCSDGLYNMMEKEELCRYLEEHREVAPLQLARGMAGEALLAGGRDNITCLVVKAESVTED